MNKLKVKRNLGLVFFYYLSTLLGTCPFVYDFKARSIRISKLRSTIGIAFYGAAMVSMTPLILLSVNELNYSEFITKGFVTIILVLNEHAKTVSSIVSLTIFIWKQSGFVELFNEILAVDNELSESGVLLESEKWFNFMVTVKLGVNLVILIFDICWFSFNKGFNNMNSIIVLVVLCYFSIFVFHLFFVGYFNIAVAFISKLWKVTNIRLMRIFTEYKSLKVSGLNKEKCAFLSDELDELLVLYRKLFELHNNLRCLYQLQVTGWVVTNFFNNVSVAFTAYTYFFGDKFHWAPMAVFGGLTVACFLDSFITWCICESHLRFYRESKDILGIFSELRSLDVRFDETVEYGWAD